MTCARPEDAILPSNAASAPHPHASDAACGTGATASDPYASAVYAAWAPWPGHVAGSALAEVVCVKGRRGPHEEAGGAVCSGPDGTALEKACVALGYDEDAVCFVLSDGLDASGLATIIEAADPMAVVSLDREAATAVRAAFGYRLAPYGVPVEHGGRIFVAVDSFEDSLEDGQRKRASWEQLKAARRRKAAL